MANTELTPGVQWKSAGVQWKSDPEDGHFRKNEGRVNVAQTKKQSESNDRRWCPLSVSPGCDYPNKTPGQRCNSKIHLSACLCPCLLSLSLSLSSRSVPSLTCAHMSLVTTGTFAPFKNSLKSLRRGNSGPVRTSSHTDKHTSSSIDFFARSLCSKASEASDKVRQQCTRGGMGRRVLMLISWVWLLSLVVILETDTFWRCILSKKKGVGISLCNPTRLNPIKDTGHDRPRTL